MKKKFRAVDIVNFVWSSVHDFIYAGIAISAYWLWHQPAEIRNNYLIVSALVLVFIANEVINYRQHHSIEKRLRRLEELHAKHLRLIERIERELNPKVR